MSHKFAKSPAGRPAERRNAAPKTARRPARRPVRALVALVALVVAGTLAARAQIISTEKFFGRFRQFVWQDQHGLPQNGISAIVRTPDGYLWLAIAEGVARFDGVRFTAFDTGNTPELKSNNVQALCVGRDGTLWIGTHGGGLTSARAGRFMHYSTAEGLSDAHIISLFEDSRGDLWIGTDGGGLNRLRDGRFDVFKKADGLPNDHVRALAEDADGNLWIGTNGGLARLRDGRFTVFTTRDGLADDQVAALFFDRRQNLWIGGGTGLSRYAPDRRFDRFGTREGLAAVEFRSIAETPDGELYFGTIEGGLYRYADERFTAVTTADGLVNNDLQAVFADPAGDLWLGTNGGGLVRLHRPKFTALTRADALPGEMVGAIFEDSAGTVWIGTDEGLARFADGRLTPVKTADGNPLRGVSQIAEDRAGNLWITSGDRSTGGFIGRFDARRGVLERTRDEPSERLSAMTEDAAGNLWLGTHWDGVRRIAPDGTTTRFDKAGGLADDYVTRLFTDRAGTVWIGTRNGLSVFRAGQLAKFTAAEGFTGRHVLDFHEDSRGNLWIGTDGNGLYRYRDGRFDVVTSRAGLYDNLAFRILEDERGNLWMSGNKGIYRANIEELEDFLAGRRPTVDSFAYGSADGMISRECNGATPAGTRTRDGRLWFPTVRGVVVVDPAQTDATPPPVTIENVLVDEKPAAFDDSIEMQPTDENLEIRFGALSWNRPAQIRYRYRLEGLDADWVEAGARRAAYYPHIAPGEYVFRVRADNGEGVWNEARRLRVVVRPPFYLTWWFFVLSALAVALVVRLLYGYRLRQLEKINEVRTAYTRQLIDYQESERKRVAVELHDSIGQSLIVIRNRALMSLNTPDRPDRLREQMAEISESAADSIREIRQIAHNLHPHQLEHLGLKTALETMIEQAAETSAVEFSTRIDEIDELLPKEAEINFYRIVQESVNNILKHSEARAAEIKILRNNGNLDLSIKDDGRGFDGAPAAADGAPAGLGLAGIGERARMLDADFDIRSARGAGTTVSLKLKIPPPTNRAD